MLTIYKAGRNNDIIIILLCVRNPVVKLRNTYMKNFFDNLCKLFIISVYAHKQRPPYYIYNT